MDRQRKVVIFEPNLIKDLQDQPHHLKLLYRILWELADPIGVVKYDRLAISAMAGVTYQEDDFFKFGKRVVKLNDKELLMSLYLRTTVKTLSPTCKGQSKVWELLQERYGATGKNPEPFYKAWKELEIRLLAPPMKEEGHTDEEHLKPWEIDLRKKLEGALTAANEPYFEPRLQEEFVKFVQKRVEACKRIQSKSDAEFRKITFDEVRDLQAKINRAVENGVSTNYIIGKIEDARIEHRQTILLDTRYESPKHRKHNSKPHGKENDDGSGYE